MDLKIDRTSMREREDDKKSKIMTDNLEKICKECGRKINQLRCKNYNNSNA